MKHSLRLSLPGLALAAWILLTGTAHAGAANTLIVAKSGGDFTTISAAMNSLFFVVPDETHLIQIMPGTYTEDVFFTQNNVHLQGSGKDITIIRGTTSGNRTNMMISDLTIQGGMVGFLCLGGSAVLRGNKITGHQKGIADEPTAAQSDCDIRLTDNIITENIGEGISLTRFDKAVISGNTVTKNGKEGIIIGIEDDRARAVLTHNEITNNGTINPVQYADFALGYPLYYGPLLNLSNNILDRAAGKSIPGLYNVTSQGTAMRLP